MATSVMSPSLANEQREWLERFARFGYAAKGFVYILVGIFAVLAAVGKGNGTTDTHGALADLLTRPFGKTILVLVAAGLLGHAVWRFVQAIKDAEGKGSDGKGMLTRALQFLSGLIHGGLAIEAARLSQGLRQGPGGDSRAQDWTAWLMSQPFGKWLAIAAGLGIAAYALWEFYRAYKLKFMERIRRDEMSESTINGVRIIGRLGHAARGVVLLIIGGFVTLAAWHSNPSEARGMGGALQVLQQQAYGPILIGVVGAGLLAYGLFQFVNARFRTIHAPAVV